LEESSGRSKGRLDEEKKNRKKPGQKSANRSGPSPAIKGRVGVVQGPRGEYRDDRLGGKGMVLRD